MMTATSIAYVPNKWENAEFKMVNYFKAVKQTLFGAAILQKGQLILDSEMEKKTNEIKKLKRDLLQKDEQLKTISYHQSHTVRRPLANIMGIVELVEHYRQNPLDDDFFKLMELLKVSTNELDEVINNNQ